jgi:hypothetical protein
MSGREGQFADECREIHALLVLQQADLALFVQARLLLF